MMNDITYHNLPEHTKRVVDRIMNGVTYNDLLYVHSKMSIDKIKNSYILGVVKRLLRDYFESNDSFTLEEFVKHNIVKYYKLTGEKRLIYDMPSVYGRFYGFDNDRKICEPSSYYKEDVNGNFIRKITREHTKVEDKITLSDMLDRIYPEYMLSYYNSPLTETIFLKHYGSLVELKGEYITKIKLTPINYYTWSDEISPKKMFIEYLLRDYIIGNKSNTHYIAEVGEMQEKLKAIKF